MRSISPRLINMMLLGYGSNTRRLLETPILADVWAEFAKNPESPHRLLLTSTHYTDAGELAATVIDRTDAKREVAAIQGFVAGEFDLHAVLTGLVPLTHWWSNFFPKEDGDEEPEVSKEMASKRESVGGQEILEMLENMRAYEQGQQAGGKRSRLHRRTRQLLTLACVTGTIEAIRGTEGSLKDEPISSLAELDEIVGFERIADIGAGQIQELLEQPHDGPALIWIVTTNRQVDYATTESLKTVKGDAARQLFAIDCSGLTWAVLDSGIDQTHPAFEAPDGGSRVIETYDFGQITRILDHRNTRSQSFADETAKQLAKSGVGQGGLREQIVAAASSYSRQRRSIDWDAVEPLVRRQSPERPDDPHGTHVAGILGGHWQTFRRDGSMKVRVDGVCRDIRLIDIRVLGDDREQTEFAVICALQFVRHLNARGSRSVIDGVNLSLSIPHDVLSYACGKTPVCLEAEELIANGTVVVAAAGNNGFQNFRLASGSTYDGYAFASITDPGNAENVITVGSTHRFAPHTYGISYFSSRGPTGDGRAKPDILAPGERITSAVPVDATDTLDGTSMAAPHVSGAAAILMARHRELRGQPQAIKRILCESATDVGRIGDFQGRGLLDILRALQHNWRTIL